jgi:hypothetical protein
MEQLKSTEILETDEENNKAIEKLSHEMEIPKTEKTQTLIKIGKHAWQRYPKA